MGTTTVDDDTYCRNCGDTTEPRDDEAACECCPECEGQGCIEQAGSCGGGCEFCPPFPKCYACNGTGKLRRDHV